MRLYTAYDDDEVNNAEIGDHYYAMVGKVLYRKVESDCNQPWELIASGDIAEQIYLQIRKGLDMDASIAKDKSYGVF